MSATVRAENVSIGVSLRPRPGDPPDPLPDPDPRNCRSITTIVDHDPSKAEMQFNGSVLIAIAKNDGPRTRWERVPIQFGDIVFAFDECRALIRERYGVEVRASECPRVGEERIATLASTHIETSDVRFRPVIPGEVSVTRDRDLVGYLRFVAATGQEFRPR